MAIFSSAILTSLVISLVISATLTVARMLLFPPQRPQQKQKEIPDAADGKINHKQNVPSLTRVYGRVKKGGDYVFLEEKDGNAYHIIVWAGHRIEGFVQHYLHDEPVTVGGMYGDNVVSAPAHFGNAVSIYTRLGLDAETAWDYAVTTFPTIWTADHRGDGLAQFLMRVGTVNEEHYGDVFPQGMPLPTSTGDGALLYDPREITHDPADPSTWAFSTNGALIRLDHLTHPSGGKLSLSDMYLPDWSAAADVCAGTVTNRNGDPELRYAGGLWFYHSADPVEIGRTLDEAFELVVYTRADGLIGVHAGAFVTPDIRITENDILEFSYAANRSAATTVLAVRGRFTDPNNVYNTADAAIYGDPYSDTEDSTQRTKTIDNAAVQSHNHMQRLQKLAMIRSNAPRVSLTIPYLADSVTRLVAQRRFVTVHYPGRGLTEAAIEIIGRPRLSLANLTLSFEGIVVPSTLYDFDAATEEGEPPPVADQIIASGVPVPTGFVVSIARATITGSDQRPAAYAIGEWDFVSNALTYELEWQPLDASKPPQSAKSKIGETEVQTGYLIDDVSYRFRLRTWSNGATSEWTIYQNVTVLSDYPNQAATFDGTNDYMARGADLTGISDGKTGTVSAWVRFNGGDGTSQVITISNDAHATARFALFRGASNVINIRGRDIAGSANLSATSSATIIAGAWHHIICSWDLAAGVATIYLDDVDVTAASPTVVNSNIDYTRGDWFVGVSNVPAARLNADLADLWFDTSYIDLSVSANRRKFINAAGQPRYLGENGELPTGTAPILYCKVPHAAGNANGFATNLGSGGNFTITGALGLIAGPGV